MTLPEKVCPVVYRRIEGTVHILAFRHPLAGHQLVKGTVEAGQDLGAAALRELREESGISDVRHDGAMMLKTSPSRAAA